MPRNVVQRVNVGQKVLGENKLKTATQRRRQREEHMTMLQKIHGKRRR